MPAQLGRKRCKLGFGEGKIQLRGLKIPFGNDNDVQRPLKLGLVQSEKLSHDPLDSVARHCVAHFLADGQAQAEMVRALVSCDDEQDEMFGEKLSTLVEARQELRALEQSALLLPG